MRTPSPVQGAHGQVQIKPGAIANHAPPKPVKPKRIVKVFPTEEMQIVAKVQLAVTIAFDVMRRLPGENRQLRSQLAAITSSGTEPCDDPPRAKVAAPSAAEVSLMERVFAALIKWIQIEPLGTKLVVGRALGHPWKQLLAEDPLGRSRAWLNFLRNNTLYKMRVDIFPGDKVDNPGA